MNHTESKKNPPFAAGKSVIIQVLVDDDIDPLFEIRLPLEQPPPEIMAQIPEGTFALPLLITRGEATTTFCLCEQCRDSGRANQALTILSHMLKMASQAPLNMLEQPPMELHTSPIIKPS